MQLGVGLYGRIITAFTPVFWMAPWYTFHLYLRDSQPIIASLPIHILCSRHIRIWDARHLAVIPQVLQIQHGQNWTQWFFVFLCFSLQSHPGEYLPYLDRCTSPKSSHHLTAVPLTPQPTSTVCYPKFYPVDCLSLFRAILSLSQCTSENLTGLPEDNFLPANLTFLPILYCYLNNLFKIQIWSYHDSA